MRVRPFFSWFALLALLLAGIPLASRAAPGRGAQFIREVENAATAVDFGDLPRAKATLTVLASTLAAWKPQLDAALHSLQAADQTNRAYCSELQLQIHAALTNETSLQQRKNDLGTQLDGLVAAYNSAGRQMDIHRTNMNNASAECRRLLHEMDRLTPQCLIPFYGIKVAADINGMHNKRNQLIGSEKIWQADYDRLGKERVQNGEKQQALRAQIQTLAQSIAIVHGRRLELEQQLKAADGLSASQSGVMLHLQLLRDALENLGKLDGDPASEVRSLVRRLDEKLLESRPETLREAVQRQFSD